MPEFNKIYDLLHDYAEAHPDEKDEIYTILDAIDVAEDSIEQDYLRAPKDKDGMTWHVGDRIRACPDRLLFKYDNRVVDTIQWDGNEWELICTDDDGGTCYYVPTEYQHESTNLIDVLEDCLSCFYEGDGDSWSVDTETVETLRNLVTELRRKDV